eukprot:COSAG06_NODE_1070_length_10820_cov_4.675494_11_plen_564_part_00
MVAMLLVVVLVLCHLPATGAMLFHPKDSADKLWDTWIYALPGGKGWLANYLVMHHTQKWQAWNAISSATSTDGAHFTDDGVVIQRPCDCCDLSNGSGCLPVAQLGSSSVWRQLGTATPTWLMAMGSTPTGPPKSICRHQTGSTCAGIYFSSSTDLKTWNPVGKMGAVGTPVFHPSKALYVNGGGDCIAALPRPGGGYYGYFSALPTPRADLCGTVPNNCSACFSGRPSNTSKCTGPVAVYFGGRSCNICGAGLAESDDGLSWTALPTPGPAIGPDPVNYHSAEVGGVCELNGTYYMTFDGGHLYEAQSPLGPFTAVARNFELLGQETGAVFGRLWGELYTGDANLCLLTHQQVSGNNYMGLVKQAIVGHDGVLRLHWWRANDALRGTSLSIHSGDNGTSNSTECVGSCLSAGFMLEGHISVAGGGVWVATSANHKPSGFGFSIGTDGRFTLAPMASPTAKLNVDTEQVAPINPPLSVTAATGTRNWHPRPLKGPIDRAMGTATAERTFKLLARNSVGGEGLVEWYVDGVLSLPVTIPKGLMTGAFASLGGASIESAHRLSLAV